MITFFVKSCWTPIRLGLLLLSAGQAIFSFEYQKEKRYLVTTHIGERIIGEFMEETDGFVFIENIYSNAFLKIQKDHIKTTQLLDTDAVLPVVSDQSAKNSTAPSVEKISRGVRPQFSLVGDVGIPFGAPAAFLQTGYLTRADVHFALPFSFLNNSPVEYRFGLSGGYGAFNARGNTFSGKLTMIPVVAYLRFKLDRMKFFLKPYAAIGSGVTLTGMTKTITATGENSSDSSYDLTFSGALGVEAIFGRHVAFFLEVSSFTLMESMNSLFLKLNFGTGYRI